MAERIEDPEFVTVLIYGHGDTVRGLDDLWRKGLSPWSLDCRRSSAFTGAARPTTRASTRSTSRRLRPCCASAALGFNVKLLIEMGEEFGSAGLRELCEQHKEGLLAAPTC